ncbi:hypothetical protein FJY71_05120 [candidate division WOR-3 bacterium]|nr:hypothetical protein [candidate division WOR-3 bacterium]
MLDRAAVKPWITKVAAAIPCETDERLGRFVASRPEAKVVAPKPELVVDDHWFAFRRYHDAVTGDNIIEVYVGSHESGDEFMGYDRLDPRWHDAEGRDLGRWEITRAYMRPKYRGRNYSLFMTELAMALCRKNHSTSVVAYPRHVAMLVTLLNYGFRTMEGDYDSTLLRILKQGRRWYGGNVTQRRLYYAQEFRPFIQDGSFIMEKRVGPTTLWDFLWQKI